MAAPVTAATPRTASCRRGSSSRTTTQTAFKLEGAHRTVACVLCHVKDPSARRPGARGGEGRPGKAAAAAAGEPGPLRAGQPRRLRACHRDPHAGQFDRRVQAEGCTACHVIERSRRCTSTTRRTRSFPLTGQARRGRLRLVPPPRRRRRRPLRPLNVRLRRLPRRSARRPVRAARGRGPTAPGATTPAASRTSPSSCTRRRSPSSCSPASTRARLREVPPGGAGGGDARAQVPAARHALPGLSRGLPQGRLPGVRAMRSALALLPLARPWPAPRRRPAPSPRRLRPRPRRPAPAGPPTSACAPPARPPAGRHRLLRLPHRQGWRPVSFAHERTGFPLEGRHREVTCKACHRTNTFADPVPRACSACHRDVHLGRLGQRCQDCHDPDLVRRPGLRSGGPPPDQLPAHRSPRRLACEECHGDRRDRGFDRPTTRCVGCHEADLARATAGGAAVDHRPPARSRPRLPQLPRHLALRAGHLRGPPGLLRHPARSSRLDPLQRTATPPSRR